MSDELVAKKIEPHIYTEEDFKYWGVAPIKEISLKEFNEMFGEEQK